MFYNNSPQTTNEEIKTYLVYMKRGNQPPLLEASLSQEWSVAIQETIAIQVQEEWLNNHARVIHSFFVGPFLVDYYEFPNDFSFYSCLFKVQIFPLKLIL